MHDKILIVSRYFLLLVLVATACTSSPPVLASDFIEPRIKLSGTVTNQQGAPVANAHIFLSIKVLTNVPDACYVRYGPIWFLATDKYSTYTNIQGKWEAVAWIKGGSDICLRDLEKIKVNHKAIRCIVAGSTCEPRESK